MAKAPKDGGGVQFDFSIENKDEHGVFYELDLLKHSQISRKPHALGLSLNKVDGKDIVRLVETALLT